MPFGLINANTVFQRATVNALGKVREYVIVFVDDVMIQADSIEQSICRVNTVLQVLSNPGFSLN